MQELVESITHDAKLQAADILRHAHKDIQKYNEETEQLIAAKRQQLHAQAKIKEQELLQRIEAKRKLEAMQQTLRCRQELIDETFEAARQKLEKLPPAQRKKLLDQLWKKASSQISIAQVTAAEKDMQTMRKKCRKVRSTPGIGGFIAENKDGTIRVDMRFETLLEDVKTKKSSEIAQVLWRKT